MKQYAGWPFFLMITPSDTAYVIASIKNGKDMWDQAKRLMNNPDAEPEKKAKPLFSTGEGKKRESGMSVWNNKGLEFYYSVEKQWKNVYNCKEEFTALVNGWEKWEPKDKSKKDAIRTVWMHDENNANNVRSEEKKQWWEKDEAGYNTDLGLEAILNGIKMFGEMREIKKRNLWMEGIMRIRRRVLPTKSMTTRMMIKNWRQQRRARSIKKCPRCELQLIKRRGML